MSYTLSLTFLTDLGEKATFTISEVKADISEGEVTSIAQTLIDNPMFYNKKGTFVSLVSARVIGKESTKLVG